jgi:HK97 family phage prohead protease
LKSIYSIQNSITTASFKDADSKLGIVTGYFANFNNKDADGDIILPGAFKKSIADTGPNSPNPRIKHLLNHDPSQPLGKITTLYEDTKGLYYESQIGTHSLGKDFIKMVESDLVSEHSIGFRRISWEADSNDASLTYLKQLQLWEGSSLTAWGANELTPLTGLKSGFDIDTLMLKQKKIEKFCKESSATDETIEMLLLHSKQLSQIILDMQNATLKVDTTEQDSKAIIEALTIFNKNLI